LPHTDPETGDRYQMFSISRPAGYNLFYIKESELASRYKIVTKTKTRNWWKEEESKIPPVEQKTVHLLSGALLPVWKYLKQLQQQGLNIVRTTTDDGVRLVGVNVSPDAIGEIRRTFGLWKNTAANAEEILRSVKEENENVELLGEIKIRKTRFQGGSVVEVCPASYDQIRELRETGLINIIQNSKQRFFVSEEEGVALISLGKVLKMYPPLHLIESDAAEDLLINSPPDSEQVRSEIVELRAWLIEPPAEEVQRITFAS